MTIKLMPGMTLLRQKDYKMYTVTSRNETGIQCVSQSGDQVFIAFGENIETDPKVIAIRLLQKPKYVSNAGDGKSGYIGLVVCARCNHTGSIHMGGGNMCASCVASI